MSCKRQPAPTKGQKLKLWRPDAAADAADEAPAPAAVASGAVNEEPSDNLDALLDMYSAQAEKESQEVLAATAAAAALPKGGVKRMMEVRDEGLNKRLDSSNKGFQLLEKMGYKSGQAIGKSSDGPVDPLAVIVKDSRAGLGIDEDRKRQREVQRQQEERLAAERARTESTSRADYVHSNMQRYSVVAARRHLASAISACETLDQQAGVERNELLEQLQQDEALARQEIEAAAPRGQPLSRLQKPRSHRDASLDDGEVSVAVWNRRKADAAPLRASSPSRYDGSSLSAAQQASYLHLLLGYLRSRHLYCLFCGCSYNDEGDMRQNCPGPDEAQH